MFELLKSETNGNYATNYTHLSTDSAHNGERHDKLTGSESLLLASALVSLLGSILLTVASF